MSYRLLAVLFVMLVSTPVAYAQGLEDFSAFSRAIGKEVSVVDRTGLIREGIVEAATADDVTLRFGAATQSFRRAEIASAERLRDESSDGAIRGLLWGLLLAVLPNQGYDSVAQGLSYSLGMVAVFTGAGYLFDAAETNRQPLYRAPSASAPTLRVSLRF